MATVYNSSISLWECTTAPNSSDTHSSATHVVIIRGSTTPDDWIFRNTHLVWETARGPNATDTDSYANIVETYLSEVKTMLLKNQVGQDGKARIIFSGHSLGASLAEALYARTANVVFAKNCSTVGCVSFDSPGHPQTYDDLVFSAIDRDNIWSLNARPNIVNTLNKPCAGYMFFSCGLGSSVHFQDLFYLLGMFKTAVSLVAGVGLALFVIQESAVANHDMVGIIRFIEEFNIRQERAQDWPTHSQRIIKAMIATPLIAAVPPPDLRDHEETDSKPLTPSTPIDYDTLLSAAPSSFANFEQGKPYRIANLEDYSKMFPSSPDRDFVVLPLIGCTGQGKTSTLAKLLDNTLEGNQMERSPLNLLIDGGINSSPYPIIAHWKSVDHITNKGEPTQTTKTIRVFLLDLPG